MGQESNFIDENLLNNLSSALKKRLVDNGFGGRIKVLLNQPNIINLRLEILAIDEIQNRKVHSSHEIDYTLFLSGKARFISLMPEIFEESYKRIMKELMKSGYKFFYDGTTYPSMKKTQIPESSYELKMGGEKLKEDILQTLLYYQI